MSTPRVSRDYDRDETLDIYAEGTTLAEWEDDWRDEDRWKHDLRAIARQVHYAKASDDTEHLVIWLSAVECHWRTHPAYPRLRDTLLTRLGQLQADTERRVDGHREAVRQRFAAQDWADKQLGGFLGESRLREL